MGAHIESLRLKAFKSVGAAWLEVPFRRGLNAVVGESVGGGGCCALPRLSPPVCTCLLHRSIDRPACTAPARHCLAGPNGCGKSSLLDALLFVSAAPPAAFAAGSLAALPCTDCSEVCEVRLTLRARGGQLHTVAAALTPDGSRAYKVDGRWVLGWAGLGGR